LAFHYRGTITSKAIYQTGAPTASQDANPAILERGDGDYAEWLEPRR
jgi:hypothetical protein